MAHTEQQEHDIIAEEAKAMHERIEARLDRDVDVIVIAHRPELSGGEGCVTSAHATLNLAEDNDKEHDRMVSHMLAEGFTIMLGTSPEVKGHTH